MAEFRYRDTKPTKYDLQDLIDRLEQNLIERGIEVPYSQEQKATDDSIRLLHVQQQRMAEDIKGINAALTKVADALSNLAVLEQKHSDSQDAIRRAHKRLDVMEDDEKIFEKDVNERIHKLEMHNAQNIWIERLFTGIVVGVLAIWVKGGL